MGDSDRESPVILHRIVYYRGLTLAFTCFKDEIESRKLHNATFNLGAYENKNATRDFIHGISDYLLRNQKD